MHGNGPPAGSKSPLTEQSSTRYDIGRIYAASLMPFCAQPLLVMREGLEVAVVTLIPVIGGIGRSVELCGQDAAELLRRCSLED